MKFSLLAFSFIAIFSPGSSHAGSSQGLVTNVFTHVPDVLMFKAGAVNNPASCSTFNQWAISMSDPIGKPMLAILLAAQAQGKQVFVQGYTQTCRDWGDRELPSYIVIVD